MAPGSAETDGPDTHPARDGEPNRVSALKPLVSRLSQVNSPAAITNNEGLMGRHTVRSSRRPASAPVIARGSDTAEARDAIAAQQAQA